MFCRAVRRASPIAAAFGVASVSVPSGPRQQQNPGSNGTSSWFSGKSTVLCQYRPQPPIKKKFRTVEDVRLFESYRLIFRKEERNMDLNSVREVMSGIGINDDAIVVALFNQMSKDGDIVSFQMFQEHCRICASGSEDERGEICFDFLDLDKNGCIDFHELSYMLKHLMHVHVTLYGDDWLMETPDEEVLFHGVKESALIQLKANKMALKILRGCTNHADLSPLDTTSDGRKLTKAELASGTFKKSQMVDWMRLGGEQQDRFKALMDTVDIYGLEQQHGHARPAVVSQRGPSYRQRKPTMYQGAGSFADPRGRPGIAPSQGV